MTEVLPTTIQEVFAHINIAELVSKQELVCFTQTNTLESVWKTLSEKNIHSAPVLKEDGTLAGIVDALDLMAFALQVMPSDDSTSEKKRARFTMALEEVKYILDKSGRDPCAPLEIDNHVSYLVDVLAAGIHRVPLTTKEGKVTHLVSQSDVVRLLFEEASNGKLKHLAIIENPLPNTGLGSQRRAGLVLVTDTTPLNEVMKTMIEKGITGIGVVDAAGYFVGNFSAQDLAGLYKESLPDFTVSVKEFLEKYSPKSLCHSQILRSDCNLGDVLSVMVNKGYHRVWLLDENKPTGLVSLTDIMVFIRDFAKQATQ
jgi:CBS domain-containing protein